MCIPVLEVQTHQNADLVYCISLMEVELPEGLEGGAELLVQDPETGQQHTIVVPNKYKPGTKIQIAVK